MKKMMTWIVGVAIAVYVSITIAGLICGWAG